jgi:pimeloyl-ACP methyl ester carboxylesterase
MKTDVLDVPGARLYHEIRGSGPVLLLVCGGIYDAQGFADLADALADRYTVVTYDRRGNSRSPLDGPPTDQRVRTHADDAHRLLAHVSPDGPAFVFGNSSGGVIALELAVRHPDAVRTLVVHEPPLITLLPDREHWLDVMAAVGAAFRTGGVGAAFEALNSAFAADTPPPPDQQQGLGPQADPETTARQMANAATFVGYEVPGFAGYEPDLAALSTRTVVAVGDGTEGEPMWVRAGGALAARLGGRPEVFPGRHGGFGGPTASAFAARLDEVLAG